MLLVVGNLAGGNVAVGILAVVGFIVVGLAVVSLAVVRLVVVAVHSSNCIYALIISVQTISFFSTNINIKEKCFGRFPSVLS